MVTGVLPDPPKVKLPTENTLALTDLLLKIFLSNIKFRSQIINA
jgi:hypothetical protein